MELLKKHGYDTKFFMHAVRLLTSAIEILSTGNFCTFRPNREFLTECRNGKHSFDEALEIIEHYDNELQQAYEKSELPQTPDYGRINQMLIDINLEALRGGKI